MASTSAELESDTDSAVDLTADDDWERLVDKNKYEYLEKANFFKLEGATKSKTSDNIKLLFNCRKCVKKTTVSCQVGGESNLRTHLKRKHGPSCDEYDQVRKRHKSGKKYV